MIKIGINGLGRIGRVVLRNCFEKADLEVTAINDPAIDTDYICYLIKYDSTHGKFGGCVSSTTDEIIVNDKRIKVFHEKLPSEVPWQTAGVQYVIEASGMFTSLRKASEHLSSDTIKRVFITAPSLDVPMIVLGVNDHNILPEQKVISCASSTLYCLAPIMKVLEESFGVEEGFVTSIHAMTPSLKPLDGLCLRGKHWREHRSIHQNIIPASTGACKALAKIMPVMKDKLTGLAFRVPIVNVSVLDISIRLKCDTTIEEIIKKVEYTSKTSLRNIIKVCKDNAVSSDFIGETHSCVLDANSSMQLKSNFFKLICWYENEYSYACRVLDSIYFTESKTQLHSGLKIALAFASNGLMKSDYLVKNKQSQGSDLYSKSHSCLMGRKDIMAHFASTAASKAGNADSSKILELSMILKDREHILSQGYSKQNIGPLLSKFVAINSSGPNIGNESQKVQERLEMPKNNFSNILNTTADSHDKSDVEKPKFELTKKPRNVCLSSTKSGHEGKSNSANAILEASSKVSRNAVTQCGSFIRNLNRKLAENKDTFNEEEENLNKTMKSETRAPKESGRHSFLANDNNNNLTNGEAIEKLNLISNLESSADSKLKLNNNSQSIDEGKTQHNITIDEGFVFQPHIDVNRNVSNNESPMNKTTNCETNFSVNNIDEVEVLKSCDENINADSKTVNDIISDTSSSITKSAVDIIEIVEPVRPYENINKSFLQDNRTSSEGVSIISSKTSKCESFSNTSMAMSTLEMYKDKDDIYDKLDSMSGSDSNSSFQISERKSQIINLTDLTNSLEDLARLDKLCKVIEISDELSNNLLSALNVKSVDAKKTKWSFKQLCEKIKLDEFCDNIFGKTTF